MTIFLLRFSVFPLRLSEALTLVTRLYELADIFLISWPSHMLFNSFFGLCFAYVAENSVISFDNVLAQGLRNICFIIVAILLL